LLHLPAIIVRSKQFIRRLAFYMQRTYNNLRCHGRSGIGWVSRLRVVFALLTVLAPLGGCATVSVYEPGASAEISLTAAQSELHRASDDYCQEARKKGLATGEVSLSALAGVLTGNTNEANAYWRRLGATLSPPATVVSRIRADMNESTSGLADLDKLARTMMGKTPPTKSDVTQFELALIHARQARDSFSDALGHVNKRSNREYQITLELTPLDQALASARTTADELAAARAEEEIAAVAAARG
jgi:ABC-type transporter Mla subunit MlaD